MAWISTRLYDHIFYVRMWPEMGLYTEAMAGQAGESLELPRRRKAEQNRDLMEGPMMIYVSVCHTTTSNNHNSHHYS